MQEEIQVRFLDVDPGVAGTLAQSLSEEILDVAPTAKIKRVRENPLSMDPGTILSVVLGSSAVTAIAHGVAAWLARHSGVSLTIVTPTRTVIVKDVDSGNVAEVLASAFHEKS